MNDDLDPLDETLARGLNALAPSEFELDADRTLGEMRPALRRARVRRRLAVSTTTLGILAVVVAGAAVVHHQPGARLNVQGSRPTVSTQVRPGSTTTSESSSTTTSTPVPPPVAPTTTPNRQVTTTTQGATAGTGPQPTSPSTAPTTTTSPDDRHATTTTVPGPSTKKYVSVGGTATIRYAGGRLTLVSYSATAGYQAEVHTNKATDIEVRFTSSSQSSRIRVRIDNGRLRPEISEN